MKRNVSKVLSVLLIAALMLSFTAVASAETRMYATRCGECPQRPQHRLLHRRFRLEKNEMVMATGRVYDGWYEITVGQLRLRLCSGQLSLLFQV